MTEIRDFTAFTSFCYQLDHGDLIPKDFNRIEWITMVGCENGSTLSLISPSSDEWNGEPPFMPFFAAIVENDEVRAFINGENGVIVTYKRLATVENISGSIN